MARVIIVQSLKNNILKKFKEQSKEIFRLMISLENQPHKGRILGQVKNILIKEIRYGSFRFYFITDRYKIKFTDSEELKNLLIKFVRMSDKKTQQKVIDEIKNVLKSFGEEGFN